MPIWNSGPEGVRLLGFASSKNTTDIAAEQVSTVANDIESICSASTESSVTAHLDFSSADVVDQEIADVDLDFMLDLDCVQDAMTSNSVQQETVQKAIQKAKSSVSGISFGSFASAINRATVQAKNVSAVINETMQKCVASTKTDVRAYIGIHAPQNTDVETLTKQGIRKIRMDGKTVARCAQSATQSTHISQTVDQTVDQTATATVTGLNLFALLALIIVAFMVTGGGGAYVASRSTKFGNGIFSILWLSAAALCGGLGGVAVAQSSAEDPYAAVERKIDKDLQRDFPSGAVGGKFIMTPFMADATRLMSSRGVRFVVVDVTEEGVAPPGLEPPRGFDPALDDFKLATRATDPVVDLPSDEAVKKGQWWATTKFMEAAAAAENQPLTPSFAMAFVRRHIAARKEKGKRRSSALRDAPLQNGSPGAQREPRASPSYTAGSPPAPDGRDGRRCRKHAHLDVGGRGGDGQEWPLQALQRVQRRPRHLRGWDGWVRGASSPRRQGYAGMQERPVTQTLYPYYTYPPLASPGRFRGEDGDVYVYSTSPAGYTGITGYGRASGDGWCGDGKIAARVWRGGENGQWGPPTTILNLAGKNSHAAGFHAYGPLGYEKNCPAGDIMQRPPKECTRQPTGGCSKSSQNEHRPGECVRYHIFVNENKTLTVWVPVPEGPQQPNWNDTETMAYEMMPRNFPGRGSLLLDVEAGSNIQWGSTIEEHNFLAVVVEDPTVRARLGADMQTRVPPQTLSQQADSIAVSYQHYVFFFLAGIFGLLGVYYGVRSVRSGLTRRRSSQATPE